MVSARTAKQHTRAVPAATPEDHLAYLLARVHHRLQQAMDRALRIVDITPTQFYALAHIAQSPGLSGAELARALVTTPQAAATLIQRLVTAGLVERDHPGRGVSGAVSLTPTGHARLTSATSVAGEAEAAALSSLSHEDHARVSTVLASLLDALENSHP